MKDKKWMWVGTIVLLPDGYKEVSWLNPHLMTSTLSCNQFKAKDVVGNSEFRIAVLTINELQAFKDYNLAFETPGCADDSAIEPDKDPVTYRTSWSSSTIDTWLRSLFPQVLT